MPRSQQDDVVRLATAPNPAQAHIWQQALKDEGISCRVVGDYLDAGVGDIPGLSAELWVHGDDVERAQTILARATKTSASEESEDEE